MPRSSEPAHSRSKPRPSDLPLRSRSKVPPQTRLLLYPQCQPLRTRFQNPQATPRPKPRPIRSLCQEPSSKNIQSSSHAPRNRIPPPSVSSGQSAHKLLHPQFSKSASSEPRFSPRPHALSLQILSRSRVYLGVPAALTLGALPPPQIEEIFKKAGHPFMWNEHLGYVLTCPSNLGTGLRGGVHVKLAHLSKHAKFEEILTRLRLQKRGTGTALPPLRRGVGGGPFVMVEQGGGTSRSAQVGTVSSSVRWASTRLSHRSYMITHHGYMIVTLHTIGPPLRPQFPHL
jgi:hypothetical protein